MGRGREEQRGQRAEQRAAARARGWRGAYRVDHSLALVADRAEVTEVDEDVRRDLRDASWTRPSEPGRLTLRGRRDGPVQRVHHARKLVADLSAHAVGAS